MADKKYSIDPYERLAESIVLQAVKDYRKEKNPREIKALENFFYSDWFGLLTSINPERLMKRLREEKLCN